MSFKIAAILLILCITSCTAEDPKPPGNQAKQSTSQEKAVAAQAAQGSSQAAPARKKSEMEGARDEFVGGVAAIADSVGRVGQAAVNKVVGIKDNLENAGSKIAQTFSAAAQNTKDIIKNIGNTDNAAPAAPGPPQKQ